MMVLLIAITICDCYVDRLHCKRSPPDNTRQSGVPQSSQTIMRKSDRNYFPGFKDTTSSVWVLAVEVYQLRMFYMNGSWTDCQCQENNVLSRLAATLVAQGRIWNLFISSKSQPKKLLCLKRVTPDRSPTISYLHHRIYLVYGSFLTPLNKLINLKIRALQLWITK